MGNSDLIFEDTYKWHSGHHAIYFSATNDDGLHTFAIRQNDINAHFKSINTKFTALHHFRNNELWAHRIAMEALNTISPDSDGVIMFTPEVINARIISLSIASPQSNKLIDNEKPLAINHEGTVRASNNIDFTAQSE